MLKLSTKVVHKLELVLASLIILAALLASIMRLMTPVLNEHRADFEKLASRLLQMPVMIRTVAVRWHGYSPEISLDNVTILDPDTMKPKLNLERFEIDFGIWRTLIDRQVFVRNMTITGMKLNIAQAATGQLQIGDLASINIKDSLTGSAVQTDQAFNWVFTQARLALAKIDIQYTYANGPERHVLLDSLSLTNDGSHHTVNGQANLIQGLPIKMDLHVGWDGDVRKLQEAKGHFYVYFEGLELSQWFSKMTWESVQIRRGLASIKVWGNWNDNQWQKLQSQFQIYHLELYSDVQQRSQTLDRISGNVGWRRDGDAQIISGDQVYIDFPTHLWPATNFTLKIFNDPSGNIVLNNLQFNYLNLNEALQVVTLADGIVSDDLRQALLTLDPKGEIQDLAAVAAAKTDITDYTNLNLKLRFSGLTLSPWQQFPGIANFKGAAAWDKDKGTLAIDSEHALLTLHHYLHKSLYFDKVTADINVTQIPQVGWNIAAKNIVINNSDLQIAAALTVDAPEMASPHIDFESQFKLAEITHLTQYLPGKILDPDLEKWLQSAFLHSAPVVGNAVIHGKWADFPFDNSHVDTNTAPAEDKFLITAALKDFDLNYVPGWPHLTKANGDITFAGRAFSIHIGEGQLGGAAVKNITAAIPYIGDAGPQILHLNGEIPGDLSQALNFIHASPLEKTLGKDLASMQLQGAMALKIGMIIPLKHPDQTTLSGDVNVTEATLNLPAWNVAFTKMNGALQFTADSLAAKDIHGELFNVPATLNITTLPATPKQVTQIRADISSHISISAFENWSHLSLAPVAQGYTAYQLQVLLTPHAVKGSGNELIVMTDLNGVALNIPAPYGKNATENNPLQLNLYANDSDAIKAKLTYNKQLSAALTLSNANKALKFQSGELRLGGGSSNWQTSPGLVISGKLKELNIDKWNDYLASLGGKSASTFDTKLLRSVDIATPLVQIMGQSLHAVNLQLSQTASDWQIKLASDELLGAITYPFDLSKQAIQGKFQRINVSSKTTSLQQKIDPRKIPAVTLSSDTTRINDMDLGSLELAVEPDEKGLRIKQLKLNDALYNLVAAGEWSTTNGRYTSHLQGEINSPKVSDFLTQWGASSSNFIGTTANVKFNINWPDAPYALSLPGLTGDLSFNLGKGRIAELSDSSNAKIGLGRMLNIFSLSTLSRRLRFDFSDMTQKGYSFDYMKGDFALRQGSATTDNMRIDGPIARVDIKGRVGLVAKDFDMSLAITPYVTGSLPVLAAFAGGPIVGVAALVVDKVVTASVSHVITYQYDITGPWANPTWTPVKATKSTLTTSTRQPMVQKQNGARP